MTFYFKVRLYIDGKLFVNAKNNPEVIDDWPLHPSKKVHFTKLVIGACWQGGSIMRMWRKIEMVGGDNLSIYYTHITRGIGGG